MNFFKFILNEEPNAFEKIDLLIKNGKGTFGEYLAKYMLDSAKFKGYYQILNNVYIPNKNGTSEIDIILLHEKGIFVIESKNYSGWIFGNEQQYKWTQCFKNGRKEYFYNPIQQNKNHIIALSNYLKLNSKFIKSIIVFSERCELKRVPLNTSEYTIIQRNNLINAINYDLNHRNNIFNTDQIKMIYTKLIPLTNVSQEIKKQHIEEIKNKYK